MFIITIFTLESPKSILTAAVDNSPLYAERLNFDELFEAIHDVLKRVHDSFDAATEGEAEVFESCFSGLLDLVDSFEEEVPVGRKAVELLIKAYESCNIASLSTHAGPWLCCINYQGDIEFLYSLRNQTATN